MREPWSFVCPRCYRRYVTEATIQQIQKERIGTTINCGNCYAELAICDDLTVVDFGRQLQERFKEQGNKMTMKEAENEFFDEVFE